MDRELVWKRPCDSGSCVEVALTEDAVYVRTTWLRSPHLVLSRAEWDAFLAAAKAGRFDHAG